MPTPVVFPSRSHGSSAVAADVEMLPGRTGNRLLDRLAPEQFYRLKPHLSVAVLPLGQRLWESGRSITHVFFPESVVISALVTMRNSGGTVEVGLVGHEGVLGIPVVLGDDTATSDAQVLLPGRAFRAPVLALREEMEESPDLRAVLLRYAQACLNAATQLAACNRSHLLEQRLASWLLKLQARSGLNRLSVTHEVIADRLGVRRAGVTVAAQSLQSAGFIEYSHGRITIVDAEGLGAAACECHAVTEGEYDRLLGERRTAVVSSEL